MSLPLPTMPTTPQKEGTGSTKPPSTPSSPGSKGGRSRRGKKSRSRRTRRKGGFSVADKIRADKAALEKKELVTTQNKYDPFAPTSSSTVDIVNPAVGVALKKINETSYGTPDGFATRLAERLKAAKYTKEGQALNPAERGGRRKSKRYTRRR